MPIRTFAGLPIGCRVPANDGLRGHYRSVNPLLTATRNGYVFHTGGRNVMQVRRAVVTKRKKDGLIDDLFDLLMAAPWWGGPLLALVAFLFFRLAVPLVLGAGAGDGHDPFQMPRQVFAGFSIMVAPWAAVFVLFCWGVTEVKKFANRKLLDKQSGLDSIGELSWREFEQLVGEAYCRQEYSVEHTGSNVGDGGIDLILRRGGETTLVQCKHWKAWKVGVKEVRELRGVVASERVHHGILVTYGSFTDEAIDFARENPITLVAGPELEQLIRSVQVTHRKAFGRDGGNRLAASGRGSPEPQDPPHAASTRSAAPTCPVCGSGMVERTAKRGQYTGQAFWGCRRYPACRGTRQSRG
jgi:restriction system protein